MSVERVKICLKCKEFIPIYPDNPYNLDELERFKNRHHKHMTVNISIKELDRNEYTRFKPQHIKRCYSDVDERFTRTEEVW